MIFSDFSYLTNHAIHRPVTYDLKIRYPIPEEWQHIDNRKPWWHVFVDQYLKSCQPPASILALSDTPGSGTPIQVEIS